MKIWLDDVREAPEGYIHVHSVNEAKKLIEQLEQTNSIELLDLDHDLGTKKTGYDFCKWLINKGFVGKFHCHTANPVGRTNMKQLLNHYGWKEF